MIAMICAMTQEFNSLLRKVNAGEALSKNGFRICEAGYEGEDILLIETGPGKKKAEQATESILQDYPVSGVVSVGFAGALNDKLAVGDLVLCQTLYSQTTDSTKPYYCDSKWVSSSLVKAEQRGIALQEGSSVSVRMPVCDIVTKEALAREFPATVVDMESYWIGQIALSKDIPFLCIRAISDALDDYLPPFDRLKNSDGSWRKGRTLLYLLVRPWRLAKTLFLYRNMKRAAESLTKSFELMK